MWSRSENAGDSKSSKFFYLTLRTGDADEIRSMFARMESDRKKLIKSVVQLAYFMRGAIQYDKMMGMTYIERELISEFIEDRLESEAKKMNPVY